MIRCLTRVATLSMAGLIVVSPLFAEEAATADKAAKATTQPAAKSADPHAGHDHADHADHAEHAGHNHSHEGHNHAAAETAPASFERAAEAAALFETHMDRVSYAIGVDIGGRLAQDFATSGIDVNPDILTRGITDSFAKNELLLSDAQMKEAMKQFIEQMQAEQTAAAEVAQTEGKTFLEENMKKEGVKTTESGLQYKVITEGDGKQPTAEDTVTVHYAGTLTDGTEFDSSYGRGEPTTFPVGGVIPGWTEALQLMKEGSKWELYIPSDLAYGARGAGAKIPPHSTLVFTVELLKVN